MSIKTNELQKLLSIQGADSILTDSAAGTGRVPFSTAAQFFGQELVKPENAVGAALSHKAEADFSNLPNPQAALYNLGARPGESLLDNGNFLDPIDQRQGHIVPPGTAYYSDSDMTQQAGTTTAYVKAVAAGNSWTITVDGSTCYVSGEAVVRGYTGSGYTIDRWMSNGTQTIILDAGGLSFPTSFAQRMERSRLAGKVATLSILTDIDCSMWINFGTVSGTVIGKMHTITGLDASTTDTIYGCFWNADLVPNAHVIAAKLELGPVQTLAHQDADGNWVLNDPPPNKAQELDKCQWYFRKISIAGTGVRWNINSLKEIDFRMCVPQMRIPPAITDICPYLPSEDGLFIQDTVTICDGNTLTNVPVNTQYCCSTAEDKIQISVNIPDGMSDQSVNMISGTCYLNSDL